VFGLPERQGASQGAKGVKGVKTASMHHTPWCLVLPPLVPNSKSGR
jgi:hypothetical protein